ncbi:hypothetical protein [Lysinibacillus agricola]|uniref:hypothetical protein n=1 Tax=Lysinibacillus agricola TaxID=2590012 RepID=UPI003C20F6DA
MLNNYSVYLSHNQTCTNDLLNTLSKHLSADLTKVRSDYLVGVDLGGKYTMVFNNSRLTFTFSQKVTENDITNFDVTIQNVLHDNLQYDGYVIHKNFEFINEKIIKSFIS